jgi:hypothetical protein
MEFGFEDFAHSSQGSPYERLEHDATLAELHNHDSIAELGFLSFDLDHLHELRGLWPESMEIDQPVIVESQDRDVPEPVESHQSIPAPDAATAVMPYLSIFSHF